MGNEVIALAAVAAFLAYAILNPCEPMLMAAVIAYASAVAWIIHRDMSLVMVALGVAIALGVAGLCLAAYRARQSLDDTESGIEREN